MTAGHAQPVTPAEWDVLHWVLRIGSLTHTSLTQAAAAAGGADNLGNELIKLAESQSAAGAPWIGGAAWSCAFACKVMGITEPSLFAASLNKFAASGGNMLHSLREDMVGYARFFALFPKAVDCIAVWSQMPTLLGPIAVSSIAVELSRAGDPIPSRQLNEALNWPMDLSGLMHSLKLFVKCPHKHPLRVPRLAQLIDHFGECQPTVDHIPCVVQSLARTRWQVTDVQPGAAVRPAIRTQTPLRGAVLSSQAKYAEMQGCDVGGGNTQERTVPLDGQQPGVVAVGASKTSKSSGDGPNVAVRTARCKKKKQFLPTTLEANADLRQQYPPVDPRKLHEQFQGLKSAPVSAAHVECFKFAPPANLPDREKRWLFWRELAKIGIFIREYYMGTAYEGVNDIQGLCNATAGLGSPGQFAVFTDAEGTILRMGTGKLYAPNPVGDLYKRMRVVFEAYSDERVSNAQAVGQGAPQAASAPLAFVV